MPVSRSLTRKGNGNNEASVEETVDWRILFKIREF